jgi:phosphatidylserine/phosphatidylglycerophosphate/cardiolipin synthase-like enzyme
MLRFLKEAKASGGPLYASLYEFNDPDLLDGLEKVGKKAHVILCNGSPKPEKPDQNSAERERLKQNGKITIYDRIVKKPHLAHHKFMVLCDKKGNPLKVWTGSTNWTVTGLCTQANNGILVNDPTIATWFKEQWDRLKEAGSEYPKSLAQAGSIPRQRKLGKVTASVWFTPTLKEVDMDQARDIIRHAEQGVLFLFFNPGPKNTLLNEIVDLHESGLFIHGVANQDPGGDKNPVLHLYDRGTKITPSLDVLLPEAINETVKGWLPELRNYSIAMVHSKVVVVDPFGKRPVVMTGSHNLGAKASRSNDDNLLIIENSPELAAAYAVNILSIYGQYKWRHTQADPKVRSRWKGLRDSDDWQDGMRKGVRWEEVEFWFGDYKKQPKR